jgi:ribosomal small subunit protein bTHX
MKTRRGKIYRGSFGKSRPKHPEKKSSGGKATSGGAGKK